MLTLSIYINAAKLNDSNSLDCLLTTTEIGTSTLEEFFTQRLSKDINNLKILTQKNCDEAILCIHIILKNFLNSPDQIKSSFSLIRRPDDRELWEKDFYEKIIFAALKENDSSTINLYQHFNTPRSISSSLSQSDGSDFISKFWMNRSLIGLNNFKSVFLSQSPAEQNNYPILNKFVNEEFILSVTQHLPDIIRLQAMLFKDFGFRIDKAYAKNNSIEQILIRIPSDQKSVLDEYNRCLTSLFKALKQIGKAVLTQWRLPLLNEDVSDLDFNSELIYILPTSMKESKLISSLIDILVCSHNSLVHEFETKNKSLRDCIQIYTKDKDIVLPTGFMDFFPETPKMSQTIAVWTLFTAYESESKK